MGEVGRVISSLGMLSKGRVDYCMMKEKDTVVMVASFGVSSKR